MLGLLAQITGFDADIFRNVPVKCKKYANCTSNTKNSQIKTTAPLKVLISG